MNALQVFYVANNRLLSDVEDRYEVGPEMRDVQPAAAAIDALIIETSRAGQRDISQHAQWQIAGTVFGL